MQQKIATLIFLLTTFIPVFSANQSQIKKRINSAECKIWVDSIYNTLNERERVAQLFIPMINPRNGDQTKSIIKDLIQTEKMGGILFNKGSIDDYATMTNYAQSISDIPVLMTLDGEWGLSMRIPETPRFPYNMGLGAINDKKLLYEYGKEVARECKEIGLHVNFAPVLDVNSNPANPVIGYRSFGEDPNRVTELGIAYSQGLEDGGVLSVCKHFPGHGDTSVDSHEALPSVNHDIETLKSTDLKPFKQYITSGLSGIMVGHLSIPALDPQNKPASLSKTIISDFLCHEMGFKGLIFTDALGMKGANSTINNCISALIAGADILLAPANPSKDLDAVISAIKSGKISKEDIEFKCKKLLSYKYALGLNKLMPIRPDSIISRLNSPSADAINRKLASASTTIIFNKTNLLPIKNLANKKIALINIGNDDDNTFTSFCAKYAKLNTFSGSEIISPNILGKIKEHDIVIVGIFNHKAISKQIFSQLKSIPNLIPVFFINPYEMAEFGENLKNLNTLVIAYDNTRYTREYGAQAIFGGIDVTGTLPVNLKNIATIGTGVITHKTRLGYTSPLAIGINPEIESNIDSIINLGINTKAFPGCQLIVAKDGNVILDKSYGTLDFHSGINVTSETIYDLASVSKATGTLPGIMKAFDNGLFNLNSKASKHIPQLQSEDKKDITIKELLYHESGMPASVNMFNIMIDSTSYNGKLIQSKPDSTHTIKIEFKAYGHKDAKLRNDILAKNATQDYPIAAADGIYVGQTTIDTIMSRIYNIKIRDTKRYNYSCLNFCLLMNLEENITKRPHNEWVDETIYAPLGAYHTGYRPLEKWDKKQIAPTEFDSFLRQQTVWGYVHDETANFSGGVQGNAGLFSNANDLAKLCQMWLNGGTYGGERILSKKTVELFTTSKSPTCRRGLGFDKPDKQDEKKSPTCKEASAATYGHVGFTGTCFWVDPEENLIYIFLCNRVNPTRNNAAFSELNIRPRLFSEIYKAIK